MHFWACWEYGIIILDICSINLLSHPGFAISPLQVTPKMADIWSYLELIIGPLKQAMEVMYDGEFLTQDSSGMVFDVSLWNFEIGNEIIIVKGPEGTTRVGDGGRSLVINADGSISPRKAMHLAFGILPTARSMITIITSSICSNEKYSHLISSNISRKFYRTFRLCVRTFNDHMWWRCSPS